MSEGARRAWIVALAVGLLGYVYGPLLGSGPFGRDLALVSALSETSLSAPQDLYALPGIKDRPLAALSLILSTRFWAPSGLWTGAGLTFLRMENLGLLLLAGFGLRRLLARSLAPFLGAEQARSAAVASALFFVLHPLSVSTVVRATERGELIAMAAGLWGLHLFLRARQEREYALVAAAGLLFAVSAFAGRVAVFLPPLVAGLEFLSAARHRRKSQRIRTATTAFLLAALLVGVERAWRLYLAEPGAFGGGPSERGALDGLALWVEKLGVLLFPVDINGVGRAGFALAAVTHLWALHPGFVAARAAPRLWGRILLGWTLALLVVEATCAKERVLPGSLEGAEQLFPAILVMAVGLGATATAIQGARRTLIPVFVCIAYALLGRGHVDPMEWAARSVDDLRVELGQAARGRGWKGRYLVIDAPEEVAGVRALRGNLPLLLGPALQPDAPYHEPGSAPWLGSSTWEAFATFALQPEMLAWRQQGLTLLLASGTEGEPRRGLSLAPPGPSFRLASEPDPSPQPDGEAEPRANWTLNQDPFGVGAFEVRARIGARTGEPPVMRWDTLLGGQEQDELLGVWVRAEDGLEARFDLSRERVWLLSGRVQGVRFPGALVQRRGALARAEVASLPDSVMPLRVGQDWLFDVGAARLPKPLRGQLTWVLSLLDMQHLTLEEYVLRDAGGGKLRAPFLAEEADQHFAAGGAELAWVLEARLEGVALARAQGRRRR
ncbi:MAG: hypothetical protein ACI8QC_001683 [Planctomycetota bacterium]|jgi:hypothetical protein